MKTLILLRHAKSSWDDERLADHQRPLAPRGRRAAPAVAARLRELGLLPDHVVSSTSVRTRETIALAAEHLDTPSIDFQEDMYLAGSGRLLRILRATPETVETLMLVGHNPGMHDVALALVEGEGGRAHRRLESKFPTTAAAVLEFDVERWQDVGPGLGTLLHFIRPKDLRRTGDDRG
jgi:phosphohistidine phosphatase